MFTVHYLNSKHFGEIPLFRLVSKGSCHLTTLEFASDTFGRAKANSHDVEDRTSGIASSGSKGNPIPWLAKPKKNAHGVLVNLIHWIK